MSAPEAQRLELAGRLKEAREYLGLSQDVVASMLGLQRPAIGNMEAGTRKVEAVELDQLAKLYATTAEYLLTGRRETVAQAEFFARTLKGLSEADLAEVARFAQFLKAGGDSKKKTKTRSTK